MTVRSLSPLLTALLVASLVPAVAAADGPEPRPFSWPIQIWLAHSDAAAAVTPVEPPMAAVIRSGPRSSGAVALTFDDGFNSRACARIADTLRKNGAVGTFFINGNQLRSEPARWARILSGMTVANHTRSHHDLTGEVHRVVKKQIRENERIHEEVLGRPLLKVLRPPYGAYGDRVRRIAMELGYERLAMWNVDTHDWKSGTSPRAIVRRATGARPGSIILMHCSRNATAKALPKIVRHYQRRGIELAGLEEVMRGAKAARAGAEPDEYGRS